MICKRSRKTGAELVTQLRALRLRFAQEEGKEHDTFCEGRAQDRLNEDLRGRAGIAPVRFRSLHADQAHADGRAKGAEAALDAAAESGFCNSAKDAHVCFPVCL